MRPAVETDVTARVEIDSHAPLLHRSERLRAPRRSRLPVTRRGLAEDALHVLESRPLAAIKLGDPFVPAEVRQVHRGRRLRAMEVGVVADLMLLQRRDHIIPPTPLQSTRFFA